MMSVCVPLEVVAFSVLRLRRIAHYAGFVSLLSRVGLGHLGKGWIVRDRPPLEDCLPVLFSSSTRAGTGCTDFLANR